ncbi:hypothetical protein BJX70DRAFT_340691 [Aspergillus crustosus]
MYTTASWPHTPNRPRTLLHICPDSMCSQTLLQRAARFSDATRGRNRVANKAGSGASSALLVSGQPRVRAGKSALPWAVVSNYSIVNRGWFLNTVFSIKVKVKFSEADISHELCGGQVGDNIRDGNVIIIDVDSPLQGCESQAGVAQRWARLLVSDQTEQSSLSERSQPIPLMTVNTLPRICSVGQITWPQAYNGIVDWAPIQAALRYPLSG